MWIETGFWANGKGAVVLPPLWGTDVCQVKSGSFERSLNLYQLSGTGARFRTFLFSLQFVQDLSVEGGIDQLVEVDEAAEADGQLLQLPADWKQPPGQRRGALVLTGLQRRQKVALNARL